MATGKGRFAELLDRQDFQMITAFKQTYIDALKQYCFVEFKGALTEQYVCQQIKTVPDLDVYYYTNDRGSCEIDFVVDTGEQIVPVEVKAEVNLRAKSLKTYQEKFSPAVSVRTSMSDYKREAWLLNLPLYAISQLKPLTDTAPA